MCTDVFSAHVSITIVGRVIRSAVTKGVCFSLSVAWKLISERRRLRCQGENSKEKQSQVYRPVLIAGCATTTLREVELDRFDHRCEQSILYLFVVCVVFSPCSSCSSLPHPLSSSPHRESPSYPWESLNIGPPLAATHNILVSAAFGCQGSPHEISFPPKI